MADPTYEDQVEALGEELGAAPRVVVLMTRRMPGRFAPRSRTCEDVFSLRHLRRVLGVSTTASTEGMEVLVGPDQ